MPEEKRKIVMRADKVAFMGVGDTPTYTRMKGFTDMSQSKNPIEYSRKYVDELFEQTDTTGMSPSISYGFDEYTPDPVLDTLVEIGEREKIGSDAVVSIVVVNFSKPTDDGGFEACERQWTVIPSDEGSGTDAYTHSGTFKVKTARVEGTAVIATPVGGDKFSAETITFSPATATNTEQTT